MQKDKRKHAKRFQRDPNHKPFILQEQDVEILELLSEYRFLDTYQLLALKPRSLRGLRRRLQYLFHGGFIDRPPRDYLRTPGPMVYGLGNKGADILAQRQEFESGKIDWQAKNHDASNFFIDHTLMVSNFRATLTLAVRSLENTNLLAWRQGPELKARTYVDGNSVAIVPDGFFTLEDGDDLLHLYVECDRSTMTRERFLGKMKAYWQWRQEGHQEKTGISKFRVLTVCLSEQRKENLRLLTKEADARKRGSAMFLFACEKRYSLEAPDTILQKIWQSPVDDAWHSILD